MQNEEIKKVVTKNKEILKEIDNLDKTYCKNLKEIAKLQSENVLIKSKQRKLRTDIRIIRNIKVNRKLSQKEKEEIIKKRGSKCEKCPSKKDLTVHHKKKLSLGGTNHPNNLQVLCLDCHKKIHPINETAIVNGEIPKK